MIAISSFPIMANNVLQFEAYPDVQVIAYLFLRVFRKTCTTFSKNTYVFCGKYNRLFKMFMFNDLYKNIIYVLIVQDLPWDTYALNRLRILKIGWKK